MVIYDPISQATAVIQKTPPDQVTVISYPAFAGQRQRGRCGSIDGFGEHALLHAKSVAGSGGKYAEGGNYQRLFLGPPLN